MIYQSLIERSNCRPLFIIQEAFFSECQMFMDTMAENGTLYITDVDAVNFTEITSLCMDGFYVSAHHLSGFSPEDVTYIQTESWSSLIAMFAQISKSALMANFCTARDHLATRWSRLCCLAAHGLPVPRALVTSDPDELIRFCDEVGDVLYKPVADASNIFAPVDEAMLEKAERLPLAPTHFEEAPCGTNSRLCLIGVNPIHLPTAAHLPDDRLVEQCQRLAETLDLTLAEFSLSVDERGWKVTDMHPFLTPESLSNPEILGSVSLLLESGKG
jgi:hypothetical protein